jgi:rod shape-determining protein MreC
MVLPILIGVVALFLLLSFAARTSIVLGPLSSIFSPVQRILSDVGRTVSNTLRPLSETSPSSQRVDELQQQLNSLSSENVRLREFQAENQQLRALLKFAQDNPALNVVGADVIGVGDRACDDKARVGSNIGVCANVIGVDPSPYASYITVNVGRNQGLETGMPVIGGGGVLIGRVGNKLSDNVAQVQLLNDPSSFINVQLVGSRATGTIAGQSDGTLRLQNVLQTENVQEGDLIVTSGLGGGLPPSLTVGQIDRIISSESQTFKEATVRPGADFRRLEAVLVIKFAPPK